MVNTSGTRVSYQTCARGSSPVLISSGDYIACDCSGFTSCCWNTNGKKGSAAWSYNGEFARNYRAKSGNTGIIEQDFVGIQEGDVLWRGQWDSDGSYSGHVGLYVGNNTTLQLSQSNWPETPNKHGGGIFTGSQNFLGFCSYDGTFSAYYDPDDEDFDPDYDTSGSDDGENETYPSAEANDGAQTLIVLSNQYTKRYKAKMKHWRYI